MKEPIQSHEPAELLVSSVDEVLQEAKASQKRWDEYENKTFGEVVTEHQKKVWSNIYRLLGGVAVDQPGVAEDLTQETFIKVWCRRRTYKGRKQGTFVGWMQRIATNTAIDFLRKNRREEWLRGFSLDEPSGDTNEDGIKKGDAIPFPALGPEQEALRNELSEVMPRCLAQLSPSERSALVMRHFENRPFREIADVLGIVGTGRHVQAQRFIEKAEIKLQKLYDKGGHLA